MLHGVSGVCPLNEFARLVERLDDGLVAVLDRHPFGGERAVSVGRAEWTVRDTLVVQAGGDDDVVEDARLTFQRPQRTTLDQARRDAVELVPMFQPAVGVNHRFEQIMRREVVHGCECRLAPAPVASASAQPEWPVGALAAPP